MNTKLEEIKQLMVQLHTIVTRYADLAGRTDCEGLLLDQLYIKRFRNDFDRFYKLALKLVNDGVVLFVTLAHNYLNELAFYIGYTCKQYRMFFKLCPLFILAYQSVIANDDNSDEFEKLVKSDITDSEILIFRLRCA
jgi:hypothetical protein